MGATASLPVAATAVEPGDTAHVVLRIRNSGDVVDEFTFDVAGAAAMWATVEPPAVSLFPDADEDVRVLFSPPRSPQVRAGDVPFAVRVKSREDPERSVAEEGTVHVGRFDELSAEVIPRTSQGRRHGRHRLRITNKGNATTEVRISAADPDAKLRFRIEQPSVLTEPDTTAYVALRSSAGRRFLHGPLRTYPFFVTLEPDEGEPLVRDAVLVQRPILPRWFLRTLLLALLAAMLLFALWRTLLRPALTSAAQDAVAKQASAVDSAAQAVTKAAGAVQKNAVDPAAAAAAAAAASEAAAAASEAANPGGGNRAAPVPVPGLGPGGTTDFRLAQVVPPGQARSASYDVPDGHSLSLTDLVLQNPRGDRGVMQIKRGSSTVLIETQMDTFRDLDYHFVAGIPFRSDDTVVLTIICADDARRPCDAAGYFAGFLEAEATEQPTEG